MMVRYLMMVWGVALVFSGTAALASESESRLSVEQRPFVHPLFANHMVLQRERPVPIWGWAKPAATVTVTLDKDKPLTANADATGRWQVMLPAMPAGGPHTITVDGPAHRVIEDVLAGDVWLCSGQSNMELGVNLSDCAAEVAGANLPNIRLFREPKLPALEPQQTTVDARWRVCSPVNLVEGGWGGFSAVAFSFGRTLHQELKVPIGLIQAAVGGSPIECWTSLEAMRTIPRLQGIVDGRRKQIEEEKRNPSEAKIAAWWEAHDLGTRQGWFASAYNDTAWETMSMPGMIRDTGLKFEGVMWFRHSVQVPEAWAGKDLTLSLAQINEAGTVWVNGTCVGATNPNHAAGSFAVPGSLVKAGPMVIAVRALGKGNKNIGFWGKPEQMRLSSVWEESAVPLDLTGTWKRKASTPLAELSLATIPRRLVDNGGMSTLFNSMIAPLFHFELKGVIWYQGEANARHARFYQTTLPLMIQDWRTRFEQADLPFYLVQLSTWKMPPTEPVNSFIAELREAQALTAKAVPHCGLAVAADLGETDGNIHPHRKLEVGRRLALSALALTYGQKVEYAGPTYAGLTVEGNKIKLRFDHVAGGLMFKGDEKGIGFAIAGADKHFVWAEARIVGETVEVSSPQVSHPVAVRYAWSDNPPCNLYNQAGLPAVPFRTDDWPGITDQ